MIVPGWWQRFRAAFMRWQAAAMFGLGLIDENHDEYKRWLA